MKERSGEKGERMELTVETWRTVAMLAAEKCVTENGLDAWAALSIRSAWQNIGQHVGAVIKDMQQAKERSSESRTESSERQGASAPGGP